MKTFVASLVGAGTVAAVTPAPAQLGYPSDSAPDRFSHVHGADCADGHCLADVGLDPSRRLAGTADEIDDCASGDYGDGRCGAACEHVAHGGHDDYCGDDCRGSASDVRSHAHGDCSTGNCDHGVAGTLNHERLPIRAAVRVRPDRSV